MDNINERLKAMQNQAMTGPGGAQSGTPMGGGAAAWSQPTAAAAPNFSTGGTPAPPLQQGMPVGLLIPVEFETPMGTVSCYMQFSPTGPDVQNQFMQLMEALASQGWKLRAFQRRQQGWGGQGGGPQGGSHYGGGGGGGWNRGGGGGGGGWNRGGAWGR